MSIDRNRNRRDFLRGLAATLGAAGANAFLPQLSLVGSALAADRPKVGGPYRALVCVYLAGGNDAFNLVIPRDSAAAGSQYDLYKGLAYDFNSLLPISPQGLPASSFGLNPACADFTLNSVGYKGLASLFADGKLAFLNNIGTLIRPITKTEYNANPSLRPPQLYSHSDQETLWNLGLTNPNVTVGWGGQVMANATYSNGFPSLAPCISIAGSNRFEIGPNISPYQMSTLNNLLGQTQANPFAKEYAAIQKRGMDLGTQISAWLSASDGSGNVTTVFPNTGNSLSSQLNMVARMIKISRSANVGAERQIYYVRFGGFDTHDAQFATAPAGETFGGHALLINRLSKALGAFYKAMEEIGAVNDVTLFTMSEFARTLSSNGAGSDHAWGNIQLALGGAVQGGKFIGTFPDQALNSSISFSRGQLIPQLGVEQMAATLATWMGVSAGQLPGIFPNLSNMSSQTLPFL
jgi:uncharacterized protein (DUF1501 family)